MKDLYEVYNIKDSLIDNVNKPHQVPEPSFCSCDSDICGYLNHYCGLLFYCIL